MGFFFFVYLQYALRLETRTRLAPASRRTNTYKKWYPDSEKCSHTFAFLAVRIRPPLNSSDPGFDLIPQRFQRSMVHTNSDTSLSIDSPQGRKLFVFDRVFSEHVAQNGIWDYLADSVSAFAQGYNVSLLAYGQSGAGKSYTMGTSGPMDQQDDAMMGMKIR